MKNTTSQPNAARDAGQYQQTLEGVLYTASKNFGFLTAQGVAVIAGADRLRQLLVRCGGCRFICAAQDFAHLSACIVAGGDYVRDVALLASDPEMNSHAALVAALDELCQAFAHYISHGSQRPTYLRARAALALAGKEAA